MSEKIRMSWTTIREVKVGTLVFQIIVQQTLLNFKNFPACTPLFQPALLSNFEICKQKP